MARSPVLVPPNIDHPDSDFSTLVPLLPATYNRLQDSEFSAFLMQQTLDT
jgi:hypothetical protein